MTILEVFAAYPAVYLGVVFVVGLVVGSFLNVVIHRLPQMMERDWQAQCAEMRDEPYEPPKDKLNLVVPRSRCPSCGHGIRAWENIPVVSYLLLRGRCSSCGTQISLRYPMVELATGILSVLVAWQLGPTPLAMWGLVVTWSLVALSGIDIDTQFLPDSITLPLLWLGLLVAVGASDGNRFAPLESAVIGAAAGYLSLWTVYHLFKLLTGKEGMGFGDFKLLAALGAWLGWQMLPLVILLSAVVGAVVGIAMITIAGRDRQIPIPFGPYLAAAGWIAMLWGSDITSAYLRISGLD